jgi:hypothetical protein
MYATLRSYRLNPIFERDFVKLWNQLIEELIRDGYVSNAVLHKESKISYVSYLQWESKQVFEGLNGKKIPKYRVLIEKIEECCNSIQVLHRMEVLEKDPM